MAGPFYKQGKKRKHGRPEKDILAPICRNCPYYEPMDDSCEFYFCIKLNKIDESKDLNELKGLVN